LYKYKNILWVAWEKEPPTAEQAGGEESGCSSGWRQEFSGMAA
jgi:hypothetical protein